MLALRAVAADTQELRTAPLDAALPVLFVREQVRMEGFEPAVGYAYFLSPMSCLFIFLFYTSRHAVTDPGFRYRSNRGHREDVQ